MDDHSYTRIFYFFELFDIHNYMTQLFSFDRQIEKANMNFNQNCMLIIFLVILY